MMNSISLLYPKWLFPLVNAYLMEMKTQVSLPRIITRRRPNMIPIEHHEQELFWLKRRIKYLEALHSHINQSPEEETIADSVPPRGVRAPAFEEVRT
jgi:hypothetical protein